MQTNENRFQQAITLVAVGRLSPEQASEKLQEATSVELVAGGALGGGVLGLGHGIYTRLRGRPGASVISSTLKGIGGGAALGAAGAAGAHGLDALSRHSDRQRQRLALDVADEIEHRFRQPAVDPQ